MPRKNGLFIGNASEGKPVIPTDIRVTLSQFGSACLRLNRAEKDFEDDPRTAGVTLPEILDVGCRDYDSLIKPTEDQLREEVQAAVTAGYLTYDKQTERYISTELKLSLMPAHFGTTFDMNQAIQQREIKAQYHTRVALGTARPR